MTVATPTKECYRVQVHETRTYWIRVRAFSADDAAGRVEDGPAGWEEILPGERVLSRQAVDRPERDYDYDEAEALS